ncbi:MFS transporter [Actinomyces ruminicola]|uniref:Glycoside/pentoside/hexuronide:cation symporter, GPH family n=1 Tax=Actinomyces ruminicola TaxID=332524 RepID=A0A1G9XWC9_9ACTO|nr:MFS transporter [Actinomyces ruminicola]SDN00746.1 glycoside/pentoside/hexuronide:cation symporter, GPH family [Actinomyces ruminicola]
METTSTPAPRRSTPPWRYAIGMFGTSIPINVIKGSMLYFYVSVLGMDAAVYAGVYTVYGVIDAVDNPVFGYVSDRTRSRWGRRRPYLIVGALLLLGSMIALFWVPDAVVARKTGLLVAWFATFAILAEASDSLINANYGALLPELFPAERRRALANSLRQGLQLIAMIISLGLTPLLARGVLGCDVAYPRCTDPTRGYELLAVIYGMVATAVIIFMALGIHENPDIVEEERPRFVASIVQIVTNRYFWTVGVVSACFGAAMALILGGLQFYVDHSLGGGALHATILQATVILTSIGFLALWTILVRRYGAARTWKIALPVAAVSFLPLFFANNLFTAIIAGLCVGLGYSGMLATNDLIFARILDHDAATTGIHREGIFLSAFGVLGRLSAIPVSVALLSLGWLFGYHSGDDPGTQAGLAWRVYMSLYPFGLLAIGAVISRFVQVPADTQTGVPTTPTPVGDMKETDQ